ncbi:thioesterase family protein [Bacterioplanoides pacificum]|uniref:Thioesterase family protein n=1 Tax=Bacterioplanoides pacificum TaxID=1171596 RepID=A0ABV7VQP0_9GAMM
MRRFELLTVVVMNLFGRLLLILLARRWATQKTAQQVFSDYFRVWFHDLGWRDHLPNYRFYSFMELGRFSFWHGTGLAHNGSYRVRMIAAQDFIYLRPLSPFSRFRCDTQLLGWDDKYLYFRHNFYHRHTLVGIGLVKEACLIKGQVVKPKYILGQDPQGDAVIDAWQALQQQIKNGQPAVAEDSQTDHSGLEIR